MVLRRFALMYLLATGLSTLAWWIAMLGYPPWRPMFRLSNAPDATLLAFAVPDLLLFVGSALVSAYALWKRKPWTTTAILVHTVAAGYAGLFSMCLTVLSGGEAWAAAAFMAPSLVVPPWLLWSALRERLP
jgi:hypothetical protein